MKKIIHYILKSRLLNFIVIITFFFSLIIIITCSSNITELQLEKPLVDYVFNDSNHDAQIIWYPVDHASYYKVLRSEDNENFLEIEINDPEEKEPTYIDHALLVDRLYYYQIEACNTDFNKCVTSDILMIDPSIEYGLGIPKIPNQLYLENFTDNSLNLRGDFIARAGYYRILSSRKKSAIEIEKIALLSSEQLSKNVYLEYTYGKKPNGYILNSNFLRSSTEYFYRVSACNMLGCSPYSDTIFGTTMEFRKDGIAGRYLGLSKPLAKIPLSFYIGLYNYILSPILLVFSADNVDITSLKFLTGKFFAVGNKFLSDILTGNTGVAVDANACSDSSLNTNQQLSSPNSFDGLLSFLISPLQNLLDSVGLSSLVSLPINTDICNGKSSSASSGESFGIGIIIDLISTTTGLLSLAPREEEEEVQAFLGNLFEDIIGIAHNPSKIINFFDEDALQDFLDNASLVVGLTDPSKIGIQNAKTLIDPDIVSLIEDNLLGNKISDIFTVSFLKDFLSGFSFIDFAPEKMIFYGAQYSKIHFTTHYQGKTISTSGSVCIPLGPEQKPLQNAPILNFYHPTKTNNSGLPSDSKIGFTSREIVDLINNQLDSNPNNNDFLGSLPNFLQISMYEFYCWFGFITFSPDYLGYKETADILHPFLNREYAIEIARDMLKAGITYLENPDKKLNTEDQIRHNGRLYLAGYSEGGYIAVQFLNHLENNPSFLENNNLILSGTIAGGGQYDLNLLTNLILSEGEYVVPSFLLYYLQSNLDSYNINYGNIRISDILQTNYDLSGFPEKSFSEILEQENILRTGYQNESKEHFLKMVDNNSNMKNFFQNKFYANRTPNKFLFEERSMLLNTSLNQKSQFTMLNRLFSENSIEPWSLRTPLRLLHARHDEVVPAAISANLCNQIKQINSKAPVSSNILLNSVALQLILKLIGLLLNVDLSFQNHTIAGVEYVIEALNWLNILEVRAKKQGFLNENHRICNL